MFFIELKLIELHTLQFHSHVQVRVDQAAVQDCGVRNSIAFEGCTLTSQLVLATLRAQQRFSWVLTRVRFDSMGRICTPRWAPIRTKTTLTCEICLRNDAAQNQESAIKA